jgi:hypothetical protein
MRQRCEVVDACLSNLFACPGGGITLLLTFVGRHGDHFKVHITLEDWTVESSHRFEYFLWARAVQTKITCNDQVIYGRLSLKVL